MIYQADFAHLAGQPLQCTWTNLWLRSNRDYYPDIFGIKVAIDIQSFENLYKRSNCSYLMYASSVPRAWIVLLELCWIWIWRLYTNGRALDSAATERQKRKVRVRKKSVEFLIKVKCFWCYYFSVFAQYFRSALSVNVCCDGLCSNWRYRKVRTRYKIFFILKRNVCPTNRVFPLEQ